MTMKRKTRAAPRKKKNGAASTTTSPGTLGDGLAELDREQQKATMLRYLGNLAVTEFADDIGPPRRVLASPGGSVRNADVDAVLEVSIAIHELALASRKRAAHLLQEPVMGVAPSENGAGNDRKGGRQYDREEPGFPPLEVANNPKRCGGNRGRSAQTDIPIAQQEQK